MNTYKAISLFSGAGGDTLGMKNAGVDVVGYIEFDNQCIVTHKINFPNSKLIGTDIYNVTTNNDLLLIILQTIIPRCFSIFIIPVMISSMVCRLY